MVGNSLHPTFNKVDNNMDYQQNCHLCKEKFVGHKRALICSACIEKAERKMHVQRELRVVIKLLWTIFITTLLFFPSYFAFKESEVKGTIHYWIMGIVLLVCWIGAMQLIWAPRILIRGAPE